MMPNDVKLHHMASSRPRSSRDDRLSRWPTRRLGLVTFGVVAVLMLTGGTAALAVQVWELAGPAQGPIAERPDDLLVLGCAVVTLAIVLRWLLGFAVTLVAMLPGAIGVAARRGLRTLAPRMLIRLTSAVLGGAVVASLPGIPAIASTPAQPAHSAAPRPSHLPDPGWRAASQPLARTDLSVPARITAGPSSRPSDINGILVVPGDTLWGLATDRLPSGSSNTAIDRSWRDWYAANRAVVGSDPDVIQPGQRLRPPTVAKQP